MSERKDLTGQRFGRLLVLQFDKTDKHYKAYWLCKCDCGNVKSIASRGLLSGRIVSCGCYKRELVIQRSTKHGFADSPIYIVWRNMKERCYNKNNDSYELYGAVGVTVYQNWINDFLSWYDYVSKLENFGKEGYSIDRYPNKRGNYEPGNVRWATDEEQARNQKLPKQNTSGCAGVGLVKSTQKWRVRFPVNGKMKQFGTFDTFEEAFLKRKQLELEYWGEIRTA